MNVLVTGGAGFIGSHLAERLLLAGHAVWVLDDLNPFYHPELKRRNLAAIAALQRPFEFVRGGLEDSAVLRGLFARVAFDQVIHLAARAGVRPSRALPTRVGLHQRGLYRGGTYRGGAQDRFGCA